MHLWYMGNEPARAGLQGPERGRAGMGCCREIYGYEASLRTPPGRSR